MEFNYVSNQLRLDFNYYYRSEKYFLLEYSVTVVFS